MKKRTFTVQTIQDETAENPRVMCELESHLVTDHPDYNFGGGCNDEDQKKIGIAWEDAYYQDDGEKTFLEWVYVELMTDNDQEMVNDGWEYGYYCGFCRDADDTVPTKEELNKIFDGIEAWQKENLAILPVYIYDHSGVTLSTNPFSCRWDSGQIGYIYVTKDEVKDFDKERELSNLEAEIKELSSWAEGDVWGIVYSEVIDPEAVEQGTLLKSSSLLDIYKVNEEETYPPCEDVIDSCWGYIGYDYAITVIEEEAYDICLGKVIPYITEKQLYLVREKVLRHNGIIKVPSYKTLFLDRNSFLEYLDSKSDISDLSWEVV